MLAVLEVINTAAGAARGSGVATAGIEMFGPGFGRCAQKVGAWLDRWKASGRRSAGPLVPSVACSSCFIRLMLRYTPSIMLQALPVALGLPLQAMSRLAQVLGAAFKKWALGPKGGRPLAGVLQAL